MRISVVFWATLTGASSLWAASVPVSETTNLLARARLANDQVYTDLRSFVCAEQIERFKGSITTKNGLHIDTVSAKISFENGTEHYTDIRQNNRQRASLSSIAGAWSEGEFGTLLEQTQILLKVRPVLFRTYADLDGTPAAIYGFDVSEQDSPWALNIASRDYRIGFHTEVWVSRASGQILQISRTTASIPAGMGISELRWDVKLKEVDLNGRTWLLPNTATYAVLYEKQGRREWNTISFSEYHRSASADALGSEAAQ